MLFDLEDYITSGVIGPNDSCLPCETYDDMETTARATRDAYFKSLGEWYSASVGCLSDNDPCLPAIKKLWGEFEAFQESYYVIWEKFWGSLKCDGVFSDDICNQYRKAMVDLKCMVKQLLRLVDGDYLDNTPIPVTVTDPCPDILSITLTPITSTTALVNGVTSEACCTREVVGGDVTWDGRKCIQRMISTGGGSLDSLTKTR
jgi:hypothetical protein